MESISKGQYYQRLDEHKATIRALEAMGDFSAVMKGREDIKELKLQVQAQHDYLVSLRPGVAVMRSDYRIALNGPGGVAGFIEGNFTNKHVTDIGLQSGPGGVIKIMDHEDQHQLVQISSLDTKDNLSSEQAKVLEEMVPGATGLSGVRLMEGYNEMTAQNSRHTDSGYKTEVATAGRLTDFGMKKAGKSLATSYNEGSASSFYSVVREAVTTTMVETVIEIEQYSTENISTKQITDRALEANADTHEKIKRVLDGMREESQPQATSGNSDGDDQEAQPGVGGSNTLPPIGNRASQS